MKFSVLLPTTPPSSKLVERAVLAEQAGFDYVWVADSHVAKMDCWPLLALIASATRRIRLGPLVTNPASRDVTETASMMATLDEVSNGRAVCGIGRGDTALVSIGRKPGTLKDVELAIDTIKDLACGNEVLYNGVNVRIEWAKARYIEMWGAGYGPKALAIIGAHCDGYVLQMGHPVALDWIGDIVRTSARQSGRDPANIRFMVSAPALITDSNADWTESPGLVSFTNLVARHLAELLARYHDAQIPDEISALARLTDTGVTSEAIRDCCVVGTADEHLSKLTDLAGRGMDVFNISLTNNPRVEETISEYGSMIIPKLGATPARA